MSSDRQTAAEHLIDTLSADGVKLWAEGEKLKFCSAQGPLSPKIINELKALKPELLLLATNSREKTKAISHKSSLILLQEGRRPPLFCIHSISGGANFYNKFDVRHLPNEEPIEMFGVSAMNLYMSQDFPDSLEDLAARYANEINHTAPDEPLLLCGYSMGGSVAFEIARQLSGIGRKVSLVVLIDSPFRTPLGVSTYTFDRVIWTTFINICLGHGPTWANEAGAPFFDMSKSERIETILGEIKSSKTSNFPKSFTLEDLKLYHSFFMNLNELRAMYRPQSYDGKVVFLSASQSPNTDTIREWSKVSTGQFKVHDIPGTHNELFRDQKSLAAISTNLSREINKSLQI